MSSSTRIYYELNPETNLPAYGQAAAVALPFLVAGLLLLLVYNRLIRRAERFVTVTGKGYRPSRFRLGGWRAPALAFVGALSRWSPWPADRVLLWTSIFGYGRQRRTRFGGQPRRLSPSVRQRDFWPARAQHVPRRGPRARRSITLIGALLAWTMPADCKLPGRAVLDMLSFMSIGIPSVIAGLAAMMLYLTLPIGLYGTVWVLVLAYSYRLAVATRLSAARR